MLDKTTMELILYLNKVDNAFDDQLTDEQIIVYYTGKFELKNIQAWRGMTAAIGWQRFDFDQDRCKTKTVSFDYLVDLANRVMIENIQKMRKPHFPIL